MVDSGVLKAMFDIFTNYYLQFTQSAKITPQDEAILVKTGESLLQVLASRAC